MSNRRQKGRKPRKLWHRKGLGSKLARATRRWPTVDGVAYDGAPQPLRQGHTKRKGLAL